MTTTMTAPRAVHEVRAPHAVVVDDHRLFGQALSVALGLEGIGCVVADLTDREALVESVADDPPTLVLLDLDLGPVIGDGSALVASFVRLGCRVLVVSGSTDEEQVSRAVEQGAIGVVRKGAPFDVLLQTVLAAVRGESVMSAAERDRMRDVARRSRHRRAIDHADFAQLTVREAQVLRALAQGSSAATIASEWYVSLATVRSQIRAVLAKLGVGSQLEAVARAHASGWLTRDA